MKLVIHNNLLYIYYSSWLYIHTNTFLFKKYIIIIITQPLLHSKLKMHNLPYEKVGKNEPVCIADEVPFEIPDSWEWARCSSIGSMIRGKGIKRNETVESGLPCVRYGEIYTTYDTEFTETSSYIPAEVDKNCIHFNYGDIIFTLTGENKPDIAKAVAYLGDNPVAAGGDLAYWTAHGMNPLFLAYYLNSPYSIEMKKRLATGDIIVHISTSKVGSFLLPVPPLDEQNRIVKKIKELIPQIEEYQEKLIASENLSTNFPEMLKKSILQEAVMGKLVPQDENDEPASVLLEKIRVEKEALIKAGKLKKDKHESIIYRRDNSHYEKVDGKDVCIDKEIPFEIPDSWSWTRFSNIAVFENGDRSDKYPVEADYVDDGIPFFGAKDMGDRYMKFDSVRYITEKKYNELGNRKLQDSDMICLLRGNVGKTRIFKKTDKYQTGFICAQMLIIRCIDTNMLDYLYMVISSPYYAGAIESKITGTAVRQLPAKEVANILIPVPPIIEQSRIIRRVLALLKPLKSF